jgi:hypothetical protein
VLSDIVKRGSCRSFGATDKLCAIEPLVPRLQPRTDILSVLSSMQVAGGTISYVSTAMQIAGGTWVGEV